MSLCVRRASREDRGATVRLEGKLAQGPTWEFPLTSLHCPLPRGSCLWECQGLVWLAQLSPPPAQPPHRPHGSFLLLHTSWSSLCTQAEPGSQHSPHIALVDKESWRTGFLEGAPWRHRLLAGLQESSGRWAPGMGQAKQRKWRCLPLHSYS